MTSFDKQSPALSVIVIFHEMAREAERTLYSLSTAYQTDVSSECYEIIALDNGSKRPLDSDHVRGFGLNFAHRKFHTESVSPAAAINFGARLARGEFIAIIVDGARMCSPGLVAASLRALRGFGAPLVCALAWHLGPDVQNRSMLTGYNQEAEDELLSSIDWRANGYRLFEISTLAQSSSVGFLGGMPPEFSWFALRRFKFLDMGGYDERFQSPGGGLVNHDFANRVLRETTLVPIVLLGEGTFHQVHGGVATNVPLAEHPMEGFKDEYKEIHGKDYTNAVAREPYYLGRMPAAARAFIRTGFKQDRRP